MSRKENRHVETLTGNGQVKKDGKVISQVTYRLDIYQQFIISQTQTGKSETPSLKQLSGSIQVNEGEKYLISRSHLILRLDDERETSFIAKNGDPLSGDYQIVGTGGINTIN